MTRKLSEEQTLKFVQLYREHECLWNIRCDGYKNKQMRTSALQQICEAMSLKGLNIGQVKAKIKSIRSTYYLELNKIEKSKKFGTGRNVYVPRMKWFNKFNSFIKSVVMKRSTANNNENTNDRSRTGLSSEHRVAPPLKPKRTKLSQMATMIKNLKNKQDDNVARTGEETDFDIFGKSVSSQLKKLSEEHSVVAQERIQSILTQCRLADIRARNSNPAPAFSFPSSQFTQPMQHFADTQCSQCSRRLEEKPQALHQ